MPISSERRTKESVNYRLHEQCSSCIHFYSGACEIVDGNISADAVCNEWQLKEIDRYHDGDYFVNQFKEVAKKEVTE